MRVLAACSLGGSGHLQPLVPFLDAARRHRHEVLVAGPLAIEGLVTDAPFWACGEPAEGDVAEIREQLPVANAQQAAVLANRELFGRLATTAMLPRMEDAIVSWRPDVVLRDPCEYSSAVVAARRGVPMAQVAISLADAEWQSISVAGPALEAHRSGLVEELRASAYLTRFPASFDPSQFPTTVRVRDAPAAVTGRLPDWWNGSSAPLIYVTLGTVLGHMSHAEGAYRTVLQAVADLDVRVLMTVGRRFDPSSLGAIPANVHIEAWVDQLEVFGEASLVVCHGGSGTTLGALASGLPMVLIPMFADQFANARKVADAGAGVVVEPPEAHDGRREVIGVADVSRIGSAIRSALGTGGHRESSARVAKEMSMAPDVDDALSDLLTRLE